MNEYHKQAQEFADKFGVTMETKYLGHYPRLGDYAVANFQITLKRNTRSYTFTYSASLHDSWRHQRCESTLTRRDGIPTKLSTKNWPRTGFITEVGLYTLFPKVPKLTMYDVLACLTKYDPGTHEEFCSDFGYDTDSRKGLEIYIAVQEEWRNVDRLFHDCFDELSEIN